MTFLLNKRGEKMSGYQALYRKWRPMRFEDVVGQSQVSDTLKGAIAAGRIGHAYLFCGTRGTGKTSTAKIFSRAVNCDSPINGEPCNECATCKGVLDGSILDVYEMDAASNRGVENIREIRDEVIYSPVGCKYKVYIIDEVHMLTAEAFNALLKTLEEPPAHAIFILATTEPHKIPATVLSRCQRFDFRRIGVDDIAKRILKITDAEGIEITPDAAELIAELGDGSMRDAISVLDRCVSFERQLDSDKVAQITGIVGAAAVFEIAESIAAENCSDALIKADKVLKTGTEAQNLIENLTDHFRCLLISKSVENPAELLEKTENMAVKYKQQSEKFSVERLLYSIKSLSEYLAQAKWMSKPNIAVEMAMVKLCNQNFATDLDALLSRIEKLEANLKNGVVTQPKVQEELPPWDIEEPKKEETPKVSTTEIKSGDWEHWTEALNEIKKESKTLYAFLYIAEAKIKGNAIEIEVGSQIAYDKIATPGGIDYLSKLFSRISGQLLSAKVFIKGEKPVDEPEGFSIKDLADKKDTFGDKIEII